MTRTILFVDDDINVLRALTRSFSETRYEVVTASTALEAAQILGQRQIDVIVSDENMPRVSGSDFLTWVANEFPACIRVVLTGNYTRDLESRLAKCGVIRVFEKPCDYKELVSEIDRATSSADMQPVAVPTQHRH